MAENEKAISVVTLALAKKYTKDTAAGMGAVKGAPCKIKKTEKIDGQNIITFL